MQILPEFLQVEAFAKLSNAIGKVNTFERRRGMIILVNEANLEVIVFESLLVVSIALFVSFYRSTYAFVLSLHSVVHSAML